MPRHIEAQQLLLVGELLAVGPAGHVREAGLIEGIAPGQIREQALLPDCAIALDGSASLEGRVERAPDRVAVLVERIERPGLHEGLDDLPVQLPPVDPLEEAEQALEPTPGLARFQQVIDCTGPHVLDAREAESDGVLAALERDDGEALTRFVHVRWQNRDPALPAVRDVARELVVVPRLDREQRRQELVGVVRLEVSGLVDDQRVGDGVRLREAVGCKLRDLIEEGVGPPLVDAVGRSAFDEARLLLCHLLGLLLAHCTPQQIGLAEGVARHLLGDLQNLVLVADHAESRRGHFLEFGDRVLDRGRAVPTVDVVLDHARLEGAGTKESDEWDQVVEDPRLLAQDEISHAARLDLEYAFRAARTEHVEGLLVVEGNALVTEVRIVPLPDHRLGVRHDRKCAQAEEVELDEPDLLDAHHVVLRHHVTRLRVAVERHQLDQRLVADHDAGGVLRGVTCEPLEIQSRVDQLPHLPIRVYACAQLGRLLDRVRQADAQDLGDELGDSVDIAVRHAEDSSHVADGGTGLKRPESHDLRDGHVVVSTLDVLAVIRRAPRAVLVGYIANHLVASAHAEVDVDVGHRHALRVQEALEDDPVVDGVDPRDPHPEGYQAPCRRTATRTDRHAVAPRVADEVRNDQEVAGKAHLLDHRKLVFHPVRVLGLLKGFVRRETQALPQTHPGLLLHHLVETPAGGHLVLRHVIRTHRDLDVAALGDL